MSIRPVSSATAFTHAATESSDRTSRGTISTPGMAWALAGLRLVPKTLWPFCASNRAVAWPTPDDAPVIKTTFWLDDISPSPPNCSSIHDNVAPNFCLTGQDVAFRFIVIAEPVLHGHGHTSRDEPGA